MTRFLHIAATACIIDYIIKGITKRLLEILVASKVAFDNRQILFVQFHNGHDKIKIAIAVAIMLVVALLALALRVVPMGNVVTAIGNELLKNDGNGLQSRMRHKGHGRNANITTTKASRCKLVVDIIIIDDIDMVVLMF
jgi:hypothetical protein